MGDTQTHAHANTHTRTLLVRTEKGILATLLSCVVLVYEVVYCQIQTLSSVVLLHCLG